MNGAVRNNSKVKKESHWDWQMVEKANRATYDYDPPVFANWKTQLRDTSLGELIAERHARKDDAYSKITHYLQYMIGAPIVTMFMTGSNLFSMKELEIAWGAVVFLAGTFLIPGLTDYDWTKSKQKPYVEELGKVIEEKKQALNQTHRK